MTDESTATESTDVLTEPPLAGSEVDTLLGSLERMRRTLAWKCADLDAAAMATTVGASTMTIGGLLRHLARCEVDSFAWKLHDRERASGSDAEGWERDWQWTAADDADQAWQDWRTAVERSRILVTEAVADGGLDRAKGHHFDGWGTPSLRRILIDMIEEYARHTGHADLIREAIDGRVGEDPPA
jgi:hypothetical protein